MKVMHVEYRCKNCGCEFAREIDINEIGGNSEDPIFLESFLPSNDYNGNHLCSESSHGYARYGIVDVIGFTINDTTKINTA